MEEQNKKRYLSPLRSMDFYLIHFQALLKQLRLQNDLSEIERVLDRKVEASVVEILESAQYEALVVTDLNKKIVWVNNGFFDMTGYPKGFAIGKKPTFLQGKKTLAETKKEIRQLLAEGRRFEKVLVNYRRNGEEYDCHIDIIPLYNSDSSISHFLAMEKEVPAA